MRLSSIHTNLFYYSFLFIVIIVSAIFRWNGLRTKELWIDEWAQASLLGWGTFGEMWNALYPTLSRLNHNQTGFSYVLTWVSGIIFGPFENFLRLPNFLSGLGIIFFSAQTSRKLSGNFAGILTAIFLSFSELQIYYSKEARVYSEFAFAYSIFLYLLIVFILEKQKIFWYLSIAAALLCLITTPLALFAVPASYCLLALKIGDRKSFFGFLKKISILSFFTLIVFYFVAFLTYSRNPFFGPKMDFNPMEGFSSWFHLFSECLNLIFDNNSKLFYAITGVLSFSLLKKKDIKNVRLQIIFSITAISILLLAVNIISVYFARYWISPRVWFYLHAPCKVAFISFIFYSIFRKSNSSAVSILLIIFGMLTYKNYIAFRETVEFKFWGQTAGEELAKIYMKYPNEKFQFVAHGKTESYMQNFYMQTLSCQAVYYLNSQRTQCPFWKHTYYGADQKNIPKNVSYENAVRDYENGFIISETGFEDPGLSGRKKIELGKIKVYLKKKE